MAEAVKKGPLNVSHRSVWQLAGPMILSNITVPLLGMVDTAVVGHLPGATSLAAVGAGAIIFSVLFWAFGFLRMATSGLTAQAYGGNDGDELRALLGRGLLLAVGLGLALWLLQVPLGELSIYLLGAEPQVATLTADYYQARIWSAPATLANYVLLGWFLGMQNTRIPLLLLTVVNGINIVLDLWFVSGLGWGVAGVAWASVIADYAGLVLGLVLAMRLLAEHPGRWSRSQLLHGERLRRLLAINRDIFIRTLCLVFAFAFFTAQGARQGELLLATNALLLNFQTFMAYALDGFAHAAEALVGRAVGRQDRAALAAALRGTLFWSVLVALVFVALYGAFGAAIVALLSGDEAVRATAAQYLPWVIASPLLSVWSYWLDGVFIGLTRSQAMRDTVLAATLLVFLPLWYLTQGLGNHGLWLALMAFMVARGIGLGLVLRAGR